MKILFLSDNFPPEVNAPASRTFEHARAWVADGAQVTVLTCAPNFPQGRLHPGYRNRLRYVEMIEGIKVVRVWSYIAANTGFAKRVLDQLSFAFSAIVAGLFETADVIVATSPQFFTTWAGWLLSKLKRRPWVFELRDIWPESIEAVGVGRTSWLMRGLEKIELALYRDASKIIAVSPAFKRSLTVRGIPAQKIDVVPNGADMAQFSPRAKDKALALRLGFEGQFVVSYIGTHGMAHKLDFILDEAQHADPRIRFLFVGDGAEKSALTAKVEELGLSNVTLLPAVPRQQVASLLSISDAALIPLRNAEAFRKVIPSKIFEAAAMGVPILLGVDGQAREIVESFGAGVYFEPENREEFHLALGRLLDNDALRQQIRSGSSKLAQAYDRQTLARQMMDSLRKTVDD